MLKNPACAELGECQEFCGMCHLRPEDKRDINENSLFGVCRAEGVCICGECNLCARQTISQSEAIRATSRKEYKREHPTL